MTQRMGLLFTVLVACKPPEDLDPDKDGFTVADGDCDNSNAAVYPGAPEVCDGVPNNCDAQVVETAVPGDFETLQAALENVGQDTLICVAAGTHEGPLGLAASAHIQAVDGPDATILLGTTSDPILYAELKEEEQLLLQGFTVQSSNTRWKDALLFSGGHTILENIRFDGLSSTENGPAVLSSEGASLTLSDVRFDNIDFSSGYVLKGSADYADAVEDAPTMTLNGVTFSESPIVPMATLHMNVSMTDVTVASSGIRQNFATYALINVLAGKITIEGLEISDSAGLVQLVGRGDDNRVEDVHIEGNDLSLSVFGFSNAEIQEEIEFFNDLLPATYAEGKGRVALNHLVVTDNKLTYGGIDLRGVDADQLFVHGNRLQQVSGILQFSNSTARHLVAIDNQPLSDDTWFRHVVALNATTLDNFIIAGVEEGNDNQYGIDLGCDGEASFGVVYDILTRSGYDGAGVTHECGARAKRGRLSHVAVLENAPYGLAYDSWNSVPPTLEHVAVNGSGTADLATYGEWPNYSSDELLMQGTDYLSSRNYRKLPYDLFRLEKGASYVDVSSSATDPDNSEADIGPFGGPGADSWDVDGDGYKAHWKPGSEPKGDEDCNDFDASIGPDDC